MAKEKSSAKKVLSIIGNVFIWLFLVFAIVVTVFAFAAQNQEGVPTIGGKCFFTVETPSMTPTFKVGDMIVGTVLTPEERTQLKVGDIVTFKTSEDLNGNGKSDDLKTHRIVEIITENGKVVSYKTAGDGNLDKEGKVIVDPDPVKWQDMLYSHSGKRIPLVGSVIKYLNTSTGFMVCIIIPLAIFFVLELISFIRKFLEIKNEGKKKITAADEEAIKQRAVAEYLKQQKEAEAAKAEEAKAAEAAAEPAEEAAPVEAPAEEAAEATADGGQQTADSEEAAPEAPAEEAVSEEAPAEASEEAAPAEEKPEN